MPTNLDPEAGRFFDVEKYPSDHKPTTSAVSVEQELGQIELDVREADAASLQEKVSVLKRLRRLELWFDQKLKIEPMGIERIPADQRKPPKVLNMMFLWFSNLMSPGLTTIGAVGPLIGVSVADSITITVVATIVGSMLPAMTATLSPHTGLRQVAVSRFAFGIWGAKLCALLNIIINVGYGVIGAILAGQLLRAVSGGSLDIAVGIVVVTVLAFMIAFLGFRIIHRYESVAWILVFILFIVQWVQSAKYFPADTTYRELEGSTYTGVGLTYFAIIFGQCCAWCSISGDYCVHYPADVSKVKVFALTWLGQVIPTLFTVLLGCYLGGTIVSNTELSALYDSEGIGGIIIGTMQPLGFSKFVGVIYALATLANLTVIFYSSALSIQLFGKHFLAVPRFLWVTLVGVATLALALGGRNVFESILQNLLPILGYWTICFGLILLIEHFVFRPRLGGYDLDGWCDSNRTPMGVAGISTLLTVIGLSFVGMSQTWYSGPLAKLIGDYGGDVSDYLVIVATVLLYTCGRALEIRLVGR